MLCSLLKHRDLWNVSKGVIGYISDMLVVFFNREWSSSLSYWT